MESRQDRFRRIAEARTNKLIELIRLLSNCSNRSNYEYDSQQVELIFSTIHRELKLAKAKFDSPRIRKFKF
jgi:hypothetical protein